MTRAGFGFDAHAPGGGANVKLTYPHELPLIEAWLARVAPPDAPGG